MFDKSLVCVSLGAHTIKWAHFRIESSTLTLDRFGLESVRPGALPGAPQFESISAVCGEGASLFICASSSQAFSRVINLPPVEKLKIREMLEFEARDHLPWPVMETAWDFALGAKAEEGQAVLLAALPRSCARSWGDAARNAGMKLRMIDASAGALANALRFNYGDGEECTALLDIGASSSQLLLLEKEVTQARVLKLGANSITQEFAAEAGLSWAEAERAKCSEGFVSLGGAFEDPANHNQAVLSKIARQFMTRLHVQIRQTLEFHRSRGGAAPRRLLLSGGGSLLPFTREFLAEKLSLDVAYFEPLRRIPLSPQVDSHELAKAGPQFGEIAGLCLRSMLRCPIELNLVPVEEQKRQRTRERTPHLAGALAGAVLLLFSTGFYFDHTAELRAQKLSDLQQQVRPLEKRVARLGQLEGSIRDRQAQAQVYSGFARDRVYWPELLTQLRSALLQSEQRLGRPDLDVGVWIETLGSLDANPLIDAYASPVAADAVLTPWELFLHYWRIDPPTAQRYFPEFATNAAVLQLLARQPVPAPSINSPARPEKVSVLFRAVNLAGRAGASANAQLAYEVESQLKQCSLLEPKETRLTSLEPSGEGSVTFTFTAVLALAK